MPNFSKNYVTFPASDVIGPLMSRVSGITLLTGLLLFTFDGLQVRNVYLSLILLLNQQCFLVIMCV